MGVPAKPQYCNTVVGRPNYSVGSAEKGLVTKVMVMAPTTKGPDKDNIPMLMVENPRDYRLQMVQNITAFSS